MQATPAYLAAKPVDRNRQEDHIGPIRVVIENLPDWASPALRRSDVYLSTDAGATFRRTDWLVRWAWRWRLWERDWPPHDVQLEWIGTRSLCVGYWEPMYEGPVRRHATLTYRRLTWRP